MAARRLVVCIALGLSAPAAAAEAATITTLRCANAGVRAPFAGEGFAPGAQVRVEPQGAVPVTVSAGPDGRIAGWFQAPLRRPDDRRLEQPHALTASDGASVAQGAFLLVRPEVTFSPGGGLTRRGPLIRARGFVPGRMLWAHIRHERRWVRTVRLGRAGGNCGTLKVRRRILRGLGRSAPFYVQVDQVRRPRLRTRPHGWLRLAIRPAIPKFPERYYTINRGWRQGR